MFGCLTNWLHRWDAGVRMPAALLVLTALLPGIGEAQVLTPEREYRIAARYAPEFRQLVDRKKPRLDFLTRFDFDGNWRPDDNWQNVENRDYLLPAYIYYAVSETRTHFFIHYVVFHPRDWKGNLFVNGGTQVIKFAGRLLIFPRYLGLEALAVAHENDLEGALVVVERRDSNSMEGRPVMVESFSHNRFRTYVPPEARDRFLGQEERETLDTVGLRPLLFVESRGHGLHNRLEVDRKEQAVVRYHYRGFAEEPSEHLSPEQDQTVGYELLSLHNTLWQRAIDQESPNEVFYKFRLYDRFELADYFGDQPARVGTALRGRRRGRGRAFAPWAWNNNEVRGQWFFDPARNVAERHQPKGAFALNYYSSRYLAASYLRPRPEPASPVPTAD